MWTLKTTVPERPDKNQPTSSVWINLNGKEDCLVDQGEGFEEYPAGIDLRGYELGQN